MPLTKDYVDYVTPGTPATPGRGGYYMTYLPPAPPGYWYAPFPPKDDEPLLIPYKCKYYPVPGKRTNFERVCPPGYFPSWAGQIRIGNGSNKHPRTPGVYTGTFYHEGRLRTVVLIVRDMDAPFTGGNAFGGMGFKEYVPAVPRVPATPPTHVEEYYPGWNAGARSRLRLDGDVEAAWSMRAYRAAVGFAADGTLAEGDYTLLSHAWFMDWDMSGYPQVAPMEYGALVGPPRRCHEHTKLRLRRIAGVVHYLMDDTHIYTSMLPSSGRLQVTAALYRGKDTVF